MAKLTERRDGADASGVAVAAAGADASSAACAAASGTASDAPTFVRSDDAYCYGFSKRLNIGIRKNMSTGEEAHSLPLHCTECELDSDNVLAEWADGDKHDLAITCGRLRALLKSRKHGADCQGALWEGVHEPTKNKLKFCQHTDRNLLCTFYMSSTVIASFRADRHGPLPQEPEQPAVIPNDHATIQSVLEFARPLIDLFASGEIDKAAFKKDRDAKYRSEAIPLPKVTTGGAGRTRAERRNIRAEQPAQDHRATPADETQDYRASFADERESHETEKRLAAAKTETETETESEPVPEVAGAIGSGATVPSPKRLKIPRKTIAPSANTTQATQLASKSEPLVPVPAVIETFPTDRPVLSGVATSSSSSSSGMMRFPNLVIKPSAPSPPVSLSEHMYILEHAGSLARDSLTGGAG